MGLTKKNTLVFVTGTRADFGKLKPLIQVACDLGQFEVHIFVTGMHLLRRYGYTALEVHKAGFENIHKYINQNPNDSMDIVLAKTISGFSDFVKEIEPDMIIVHGDRVEALACTIVGSLNNIPVAHIEGGEVSGTIDELLRHSITKLSHLHLVCNEDARRRLMQMGEEAERIKVIGSPDLDIMNSKALPSLEEVREHYKIPFESFAIFMYHPVTTETEVLSEKIHAALKALQDSGEHYVIIYPNNDHGADIIIEAIDRLVDSDNFRVFPSLRFEYFLTLLENADYIIGNSSAGVREAPFYGVPTVNIGSRQKNRASAPTIIDSGETYGDILDSIKLLKGLPRTRTSEFGDGKSVANFLNFLSDESTWSCSPQKHFVDYSR